MWGGADTAAQAPTEPTVRRRVGPRTRTGLTTRCVGRGWHCVVLTDVQDEMECPLCLEEIDISDANFKPCPCGYQVRRASAGGASGQLTDADLPLLLAPHQAEPEWAVPRVPAQVLGPGDRVQGHVHRRVRTPPGGLWQPC